MDAHKARAIVADLRGIAREIRETAKGSSRVAMYDALAGQIDEQAAAIELDAQCPKGGQHVWGTAYKSSSGRVVCTKCGYVTDAPFEALGVAER